MLDGWISYEGLEKSLKDWFWKIGIKVKVQKNIWMKVKF